MEKIVKLKDLTLGDVKRICDECQDECEGCDLDDTDVCNRFPNNWDLSGEIIIHDDGEAEAANVDPDAAEAPSPEKPTNPSDMTLSEYMEELEKCPGRCKSCAWNDDHTCRLAMASVEIDMAGKKVIDTASKQARRYIVGRLIKMMEDEEDEEDD